MKKELFALKGMICYSKNQREMVFMEDSYVVCENGICAGVFSQLPEEYKDILTVGSVNIDNEQELARQERIEVVPTLVLYKNGQAMDSIVGPGSKAAVEDFIRKNS